MLKPNFSTACWHLRDFLTPRPTTPNDQPPAMVPLPSLPLEIKDAIIDQVASGALSSSDLIASQFRQTLLSFNAASTVTRHRALKYIYKKIQIFNDSRSQERIKALRELIEAPSSIGNVHHCIKEVVFSFSIPPTPPRRRLPHLAPLSPENIMNNQDLIFILQSFNRKEYGVKKFTLKFYPCVSFPQHVKWTNVPSTFQSAVQDLIHSPHLLSLHIRGVSEFPISVLGDAGLKNLVMYQNGVESVEHRVPSMGSPSLKSLSTNSISLIRNSTQIHRAFFQNLTELILVSWPFDPHVTLQPVLLQCGHNLLKLTLDILGPLEFDFETLHIMPKLKAFAITSRRGGSEVSTIRRVARLLDVIQPMEHLEEVTLELGLRDDNGFGPFMDITNSAWQLIDATLSSEKYPTLRNVNISVAAIMVYHFFDDFDQAQFIAGGSAYLSQQFHRLRNSDMSFDCQLFCDNDVLVGYREDYDDA